MKQEDVRQVLEEYPQLRSKLFARGFLFTDASVDEEIYPLILRFRITTENCLRFF